MSLLLISLQVQEFHLAGLESLESTLVLRLIRERLLKFLSVYKEKEGDYTELKRVDNLDIRKYDFILKKINKIEDQEEYTVELDFLPREVAEEGVSLNELIKYLVKVEYSCEGYEFTC